MRNYNIRYRYFHVSQSQFERKHVGYDYDGSPHYVRHGLQFKCHVKNYSHASLRKGTV